MGSNIETTVFCHFLQLRWCILRQELFNCEEAPSNSDYEIFSTADFRPFDLHENPFASELVDSLSLANEEDLELVRSVEGVDEVGKLSVDGVILNSK